MTRRGQYGPKGDHAMVKLTQNSWLGGQMDERMSGRQDMKNYRNGASVLKNFVPVKLGSIRKRPGTDLVCDITDYVGTGTFRMIPFGFLSGEGFVLVLCAGKARAYKADGSYVDVTGIVPYSADELDQIGYVQCGDIVYLAHQNHPPAEIRHNLNGTTHSFSYSTVAFVRTVIKPSISDSGTFVRRVHLKNTDAGATITEHYKVSAILKDTTTGEEFETNPSNSYGKGSAGGEGEDLIGNEWRAYVIGEITAGRMEMSDLRSSAPDWFYEWAPKQKEGISNISQWNGTTYRAPWTQSQTITISCSISVPSGFTLVKYRIYKDAGGVFGLIGENKTGTFIDDNIAPDTSVTPIDDSDGVPFSTDGNYPGSVGLYQQRLVWAGTKKDPSRIWMSRAGDLYEYRPHDKLQLDDAIDFILPITQFANINFIIELGRLFAFAECTELVIGSASDSAGVSYETIMATEHSHLGCTKRLPPIVANNTLLFVNRTGQSVRDYDEKLGSTRFGGTDVSIFSSSIFADNPIVDWTWQQEPNSTVWCVLKDGRLASFTYDKEQEIMAWAVHELGGGGKAVGIAKTCAVFGREAGRPTTGEIMVAVERRRAVDGTEQNETVITLERMRPWGAADGTEADRLCMDCCMTDSSRGMPGMHMVDADGGYVYGFPFESVMTTMPPVIGDQIGQAQFDVKLGQHAHLRTIGSQGGEIYAVGMRSQASRIDDGAVRDGEDGAAFKDVDVVLAGSNSRDGRVTVLHDKPGPFQLTLLELDYETEQ